MLNVRTFEEFASGRVPGLASGALGAYASATCVASASTLRGFEPWLDANSPAGYLCEAGLVKAPGAIRGRRQTHLHSIDRERTAAQGSRTCPLYKEPCPRGQLTSYSPRTSQEQHGCTFYQQSALKRLYATPRRLAPESPTSLFSFQHAYNHTSRFLISPEIKRSDKCPQQRPNMSDER